jgi:hypothetical protein
MAALGAATPGGLAGGIDPMLAYRAKRDRERRTSVLRNRIYIFGKRTLIKVAYSRHIRSWGSSLLVCSLRLRAREAPLADPPGTYGRVYKAVLLPAPKLRSIPQQRMGPGSTAGSAASGSGSASGSRSGLGVVRRASACPSRLWRAAAESRDVHAAGGSGGQGGGRICDQEIQA